MFWGSGAEVSGSRPELCMYVIQENINMLTEDATYIISTGAVCDVGTYNPAWLEIGNE